MEKRGKLLLVTSLDEHVIKRSTLNFAIPHLLPYSSANGSHHPSPTSLIRSTLGFILVGLAWGLTTPFIRRAAVNFKPPAHSSLSDPDKSWLTKKILGAIFAVIDLLRHPAYAVPLVLNLTGSIWFFLLVGQEGEFSKGLVLFGREREEMVREGLIIEKQS